MLGILAAALANLWLYSVTEVGTHSMIALDRFASFSNWIILSGALLGVLISQSYVQNYGQAAEVALDQIQLCDARTLPLFGLVGRAPATTR